MNIQQIKIDIHTSINLENASIDKLYKIVEKYFPNIEKSIEDKLKRLQKTLRRREREYKFKTYI